MSSSDNEVAGPALKGANGTPEKGGLDKLGMVIEIAKAGLAGEKPNWNELAVKLGSASGASLQKTWQNLLKSHVITKKDATKVGGRVAKAKVTKKKAAPKKKGKVVKKDVDGAADEEDGGPTKDEGEIEDDADAEEED